MFQSSNDLPTLEELDRDGALREGAERTGLPRAAFMRRLGAFAGAGLVIGGLPAEFAFAQGSAPPASDIAILNYALTLEYLESSFYNEANSKGALSGQTKSFSKVVAQHETAHVAALKKALGSKAIKEPKFDFKGTTSKQSTFQQTAIALEDTGVKAYLGQAGNIKTKAILAAAASILPVEARHSAWIRNIVGQTPAPDAFQPSATMAQVLQVVKGTGFVVGMASAAPSGAHTGNPSMTG
jgi:rubrerythrin